MTRKSLYVTRKSLAPECSKPWPLHGASLRVFRREGRESRGCALHAGPPGAVGLDDRVPVALSQKTLRTTPGPTTSRRLRSCGKFPLEEPELKNRLEGLETVVADAAYTPVGVP